MITLHTAADVQAWSLRHRREGFRIGFVPTMGYLHEGHLSLIRLARAHADRVVVSVFVNKTQFGEGEDFASYPRDFERDRERCRRERVDLVFAPSDREIYAGNASTVIREENLSRGLCGRHRPGHFSGVTTIVGKLFNLVGPDVAVFGRKDAQQLAVIRRMVRDLHFPVEIMAGPIVREEDGLALSSRNARLGTEERKQAVCLVKALRAAEALYSSGETAAAALAARMREVIASYPLARLQYAEVVDWDSLAPVKDVVGDTLLALAVFVGEIRLIDNAVIGPGVEGESCRMRANPHISHLSCCNAG